MTRLELIKLSLALAPPLAPALALAAASLQSAGHSLLLALAATSIILTAMGRTAGLFVSVATPVLLFVATAVGRGPLRRRQAHPRPSTTGPW